MGLRARIQISVLFFCVAIFPYAVQAETVGLVVEPFAQEVTLDQDQHETTFIVTLENTQPEILLVYVETTDFGTLDESGGVAFIGSQGSALEQRYALASWLQPEAGSVILNPGESKSLRVRVENRENLTPGGHYGALLFRLEQGQETSAAEKSQITVNQYVSALIFLKKTGGERWSLALREWTWERLGWWKGQFPERLRLRFQNDGNVHVVPRGTAVVADPLRRVVVRGIINADSSIILPESFRVYPVSLQSLETVFMPGRYTYTIDYRFDGREELTQQTGSFFYFPLFSVIVILAGVGAAGLILVWDRRRKRLLK